MRSLGLLVISLLLAGHATAAGDAPQAPVAGSTDTDGAAPTQAATRQAGGDPAPPGTVDAGQATRAAQPGNQTDPAGNATGSPTNASRSDDDPSPRDEDMSSMPWIILALLAILLFAIAKFGP